MFIVTLVFLGLGFYDPYAIIDITKGHMEGDDYTLVHIDSEQDGEFEVDFHE